MHFWQINSFHKKSSHITPVNLTGFWLMRWSFMVGLLALLTIPPLHATSSDAESTTPVPSNEKTTIYSSSSSSGDDNTTSENPKFSPIKSATTISTTQSSISPLMQAPTSSQATSTEFSAVHPTIYQISTHSTSTDHPTSDIGPTAVYPKSGNSSTTHSSSESSSSHSTSTEHSKSHPSSTDHPKSHPSSTDHSKSHSSSTQHPRSHHSSTDHSKSHPSSTNHPKSHPSSTHHSPPQKSTDHTSLPDSTDNSTSHPNSTDNTTSHSSTPHPTDLHATNFANRPNGTYPLTSLTNNTETTTQVKENALCEQICDKHRTNNDGFTHVCEKTDTECLHICKYCDGIECKRVGINDTSSNTTIIIFQTVYECPSKWNRVIIVVASCIGIFLLVATIILILFCIALSRGRYPMLYGESSGPQVVASTPTVYYSNSLSKNNPNRQPPQKPDSQSLPPTQVMIVA